MGLPFHLKDYVELVEWSGRILRSDKRGAIPADLPPILERLDIDAKRWLILTTQFESSFKVLVGASDRLKLMASAFKSLSQRVPTTIWVDNTVFLFNDVKTGGNQHTHILTK